MKNLMLRATPFALTLLLASCGDNESSASQAEATANVSAKKGEAEGGGETHHEGGVVELTAQQVKAAGIEVVRPIIGGGGMLNLPATIEGDPQNTQVVSAAIGGRVVALHYNLGQPVTRGQVVATIESREAATIRAEVEAASARLALARSTVAREERLFKLRVSPERDVIAARTQAAEARIALRLAQQQVSAAGVGVGALNRIGIVSPLSGRITARSVVLGQTVAADAELFRVSNLSRVAVTVSLSPADAARVSVGTPVEVGAGGRTSSARVSFVSPVLDETSRLVQLIALIDNRGGQWRVGEAVSASIKLPSEGGTSITVPASAIQTVENRQVVFVRNAHGFKAVPVAIGARSAGSVVISQGLTGSEEIAAGNSFTLKSALGAAEAGHED